MPTITQTIAATEAAVTTAKLFALHYESKLPEGLGNMSISNHGVTFSCSLEYVSDDYRLRALAVFGDVFGRADWTAEAGYGNRSFHWSKTIDQVCITIYHAQKNEVVQTFPVAPTQFPLQLTEC